MDVAVFKRVLCHLAVCVYGGSLVFCLHAFCTLECSQYCQLLGLIVVHILFNLCFRLAVWSPDLNKATPAPTPCSDLLPSLNI